jgi:hypothetical protein
VAGGNCRPKQALQKGDRVIALVNTSAPRRCPNCTASITAWHSAAKAGITIERNLIGSYCTSLDMAGFSITLLKADDETLALGRPGPHPGAELGQIRSNDMSLSRTQIVDWLYRCGDIFTKESDFLTGWTGKSAMPTTA